MTPALALEYLEELSADIRAGAVLDAGGALLAGTEPVGDAARDLLAAAGDARELQVTTAGGAVFGVRDDRHALVVACGHQVLASLLFYDLRVVLAELRGGRARPEAA
jgi:hypothetical protein